MTDLKPATPRHRQPPAPLRLALLGDEAYGPAAAEVAVRLERGGHRVTVASAGLRTVFAAAHGRCDAVVVLGTGRIASVLLLKLLGVPVVVHLDGRSDPAARSGGRRRRDRVPLRERLAVHTADALVAPSFAVVDRMDDVHQVPVERIGWGAELLRHTPSDAIEALGLVPGQYHLTTTGFEGGLGLLLAGFISSTSGLPLVVAGTAIPDRAGDARVRPLGPVTDRRVLDQLHAHAATTLHGWSTAAPNLSVPRAMGAGAPVLALGAAEHREVAGTAGLYFDTARQLARLLEDAERYPQRFAQLGTLMQDRAAKRLGWDAVAEAYEAVAARVVRRRVRPARRTRRAEPVPTLVSGRSPA